MGQTDLTVLLRRMEPELHDRAYGFGLWAGGALPLPPFATVVEAEGLTVVAGLAEVEAAGMVSEPWARISLTVHSDLAAVGLTATIAGALASQGISCNVIAGLHHDHLFVPWERREDGLACLRALADA